MLLNILQLAKEWHLSPEDIENMDPDWVARMLAYSEAESDRIELDEKKAKQGR